MAYRWGTRCRGCLNKRGGGWGWENWAQANFLWALKWVQRPRLQSSMSAVGTTAHSASRYRSGLCRDRGRRWLRRRYGLIDGIRRRRRRCAAILALCEGLRVLDALAGERPHAVLGTLLVGCGHRVADELDELFVAAELRIVQRRLAESIGDAHVRPRRDEELDEPDLLLLHRRHDGCDVVRVEDVAVGTARHELAGDVHGFALGVARHEQRGRAQVVLGIHLRTLLQDVLHQRDVPPYACQMQARVAESVRRLDIAAAGHEKVVRWLVPVCDGKVQWRDLRRHDLQLQQGPSLDESLDAIGMATFRRDMERRPALFVILEEVHVSSVR
mmetsp:Transcript_20087/g.60892  ORF Transcript_20087/g.60892 Transcript_20087/m.60892 type:complete len:329 (+) Transcript_20087:54-1040(+)